MKVSVIVLSWGHAEDLTVPFLKDYRQHQASEATFEKVNEHELLLIEQGSPESDRALLRELSNDPGISPWLEIIQLEKNVGFPKGCNIGMARASGDVIVLMNNDMRINGPWMLPVLSTLGHPGEKNIVGASYVHRGGWNEMDIHGAHMISPYLEGWLLAFHRSALEEIGYLDEIFGLGSMEDVDWCWRASRAGYQLKVAPPLPVKHLRGGSMGDGRLNNIDITKANQRAWQNKVIEFEVTRQMPDPVVTVKSAFIPQVERGPSVVPVGPLPMPKPRKPGEGLKISLYMRDNLYAFTPPDIWGKGVGGSEYAFMLTAKALAALGNDVTVYNSTVVPQVYDDVKYMNFRAYRPQGEDLFVAFRHSYHGPRDAKKFVFWSCDQYTDHQWNAMLPRLDAFVCISTFHRNYVAASYPVDPDKLKIVPLGANTPEYREKIEKVPFKMIYCSVPHRGLGTLLDSWSEIKKRVPDATLVITSDYTLWGVPNAHNGEFAPAADRLRGLGVEPLWKVTRSELVRHQLESEIMTYPCSYDENYCISARECIVAGAVPVTFGQGAVGETVGDFGVVLHGNSNDPEKKLEFTNAVIELVLDRKRLAKLSNKGKREAKKDDYDLVARRLLEASGL